MSTQLPKAELKRYQKTRSWWQRHRICHAPWRSMFIRHLGQVMPCCGSEGYVYGTYPQNTLREIWESQAHLQLRKAIQDGNLTLGCQVCEKGLRNGNLSTLKTYDYDFVRDYKGGQWPTRIEFELENTCNLECIMCNGYFSSSIRKNREKLPPLDNPYGDDFLKQLDPFLPHLQKADFYGGEPFLIEIYLKIWERLVEVNPRCTIYVQTNGTILSQRVLNIIRRLPMEIGLSLDSAVATTYESIRVNAHFHKVIANLEKILEIQRAKKVPTFLSKCLMTVNWLELDEYYKLAQRYQLPIYLHYVRRPSDLSIYSLDSETLLRGTTQLQQWLDAEKPLTRVDHKNHKVIQDAVNVIRQWNQENQAHSLRQLEIENHLGALLARGTILSLNGQQPDGGNVAYTLSSLITLLNQEKPVQQVNLELNSLVETLANHPLWLSQFKTLLAVFSAQEMKHIYDSARVDKAAAFERALAVAQDRFRRDNLNPNEMARVPAKS